MSEPSPLPSFTEPQPYAPFPPPQAPEPAPGPAPRRGTSGGTIAAIVLVAVAVVGVIAMALVGAGIFAYSYFAPTVEAETGWEEPGWDEAGWAGDFDAGTVTTADGRTVDGMGDEEHPAAIGEHTLSWTTAEGGVISVTVGEVNWDAAEELSEVDPDTPPGMVYVQAAVHMEYSGPGRFIPVNDLWLSLETYSWYSAPEEVDVVSAAPLWDVGALSDGDSADALIVFEMPAEEQEDALFAVETADGLPLYLAER